MCTSKIILIYFEISDTKHFSNTYEYLYTNQSWNVTALQKYKLIFNHKVVAQKDDKLI